MQIVGKSQPSTRICDSFELKPRVKSLQNRYRNQIAALDALPHAVGQKLPLHKPKELWQQVQRQVPQEHAKFTIDSRNSENRKLRSFFCKSGILRGVRLIPVDLLNIVKLDESHWVFDSSTNGPPTRKHLNSTTFNKIVRWQLPHFYRNNWVEMLLLVVFLIC